MPTSALLAVSNSPKIAEKSVRSAWADVGIGPYRVLHKFAAACCVDRGVRPCESRENPAYIQNPAPGVSRGRGLLQMDQSNVRKRWSMTATWARVALPFAVR